MPTALAHLRTASKFLTQLDWRLVLQIAVTLVSAYALLNFLPNALGRFYLWAVDCHFHPYWNHSDDIGETANAGNLALPIALIGLLLARKSPKPIRLANLALTALGVITFILFWTMVKMHGLVSYDEFVIHGV